jgi:hypothetical protein
MQYKFVGDGSGVPGLPLEISEDEALQLGEDVALLLAQAIENGNYVLVDEAALVGRPKPNNKSKVKEQTDGE